jgi:hypothetical protein
MRGTGLWNPNAFRVSEPILVPVLDPGRLGLTERRSCAGIEGSPISPAGFSVVPSTPVGVSPQTRWQTRLLCTPYCSTGCRVFGRRET